MDKMLISPDSDVIVSNDGATIMEHMEVIISIKKLIILQVCREINFFTQKYLKIEKIDCRISDQ